MKKILIALLLTGLFLIGCSEYTKIEQNVTLQSRIDCTYYINSYLWVKKSFPNSLTDYGSIGKCCFSSSIKASEIETEKAKHLAELQPYKEQLERIFKDENRKCEKP